MACSNVVYRLELYNPKTRKYTETWKGWDYSRAIIMFNKSYNKRHTRRLVRVETDVILKRTKDKRGWSL